VRRIALEHPIANLPLGILDQQTALSAFKKHDDRDHDDRQYEDRQNEPCRQGTGAAKFQRMAQGRWQTSDNAGEDDQGNAVANATRGDLLAQPHQEHCSAGQT
jgi:hypothetical protein